MAIRQPAKGWLLVPNGGTDRYPSVFTSTREALKELAQDVADAFAGLAKTDAKLAGITVASSQAATILGPVLPGGSGGSVTSVGLSLPATMFTVSGSPVTTAGTLTGTFATQTANTAFMGPASGPAGAPAFRALVLTDLPDTSTQYQMLQSGGSADPAYSTATWPATTAANQLLYSSAANAVTGLASANNSILVTNGTGVPSFGTDLQTAVTIGTAYIYRVGGTDVSLADGGTAASLAASNGGIVYSTASAMAILAGTSTAGRALISGATAAPSWWVPAQGSVVFIGLSGILSVDNANFFWDDAENRLGIGTAAPTTKLHVAGEAPGANDVVSAVRIDRNTSVTATPGIGVALNYYLENGSGGLVECAALAGIMTTVTAGAEVGAMDFYTKPGGGGIGAVGRWHGNGNLIIGNLTDSGHRFEVQGGRSVFATPVAGYGSYRLPAGTAPSSPVEGDAWNDSTQKAEILYIDGIKQHRGGTLFAVTANVSVSNTTTETSIVGSGVGTMTLPANFLVVGKSLRFTASGYYGTGGSTRQLTILFKIGSTSISNTQTLPASMTDGRPWWIEIWLTCQSTGATGGSAIRSTGFLHQETNNLFGNPVTWDLGSSGGNSVVDTTIANLADLRVQWGAGAGVADTITCSNLTLECLA